jgi:hypothetical protein
LKPCACFAGFFACERRAAIALLSFSAISGSLCSGRADRDCTNISLPDQAIWRQGRIKTTGPTYRSPAPLNHPATPAERARSSHTRQVPSVRIWTGITDGGWIRDWVHTQL